MAAAHRGRSGTFGFARVGLCLTTAALAWFLTGAVASRANDPEPETPTTRPTSVPSPPRDRYAPLRGIEGMIVSCPRSGREWGRDGMVASMKELRELGVEWVGIHPYAGIRKDGSVPQWFDLTEPPVWITRPIAEAKKLGMKVMIKPHLGYWGSGFSWRGEIKFEEAAHWERFFTEYRAWINRVAECSAGADLFVVGTELDQTLEHTDEWRRIIREVDSRYEGPLTYSANWTDYHRVPFWDDLDVIGVHAYFPLVDEGEEPTRFLIEAGWRRNMATLSKYSESQKLPIVFTELGYNHSSATAYRPWEHETDRHPEAERIQSDCLDVALKMIADEKRVLGAFLWKWFSEHAPPSNFSMHSDAMRTVIRRHWKRSAPTGSSTTGGAPEEGAPKGAGRG
ncbi:MAG: hypothetical protein AAF488_17875 [Planctomycetota bacterium]